MSTNAPIIKMPPLAHNLIDTDAVKVICDWINGLAAPASTP
jgi:hypothetical protein